jgi:hypothetical protein
MLLCKNLQATNKTGDNLIAYKQALPRATIGHYTKEIIKKMNKMLNNTQFNPTEFSQSTVTFYQIKLKIKTIPNWLLPLL